MAVPVAWGVSRDRAARIRAEQDRHHHRGQPGTGYLAKELGPRGITANTVAPGAIATDFGGGVVRDNEQVRALMASQTALRRVGVAQDIGGVISALLADGTKWINAQRIEASGGALI